MPASSSEPELPWRQVHLDFHTGPAILDVGTRFDAREFARVMKAARVNNVNVFAKCHHGHLYYATSRPERHPASRATSISLANRSRRSTARAFARRFTSPFCATNTPQTPTRNGSRATWMAAWAVRHG